MWQVVTTAPVLLPPDEVPVVPPPEDVPVVPAAEDELDWPADVVPPVVATAVELAEDCPVTVSPEISRQQPVRQQIDASPTLQKQRCPAFALRVRHSS